MKKIPFQLVSPYKPSDEQERVAASLADGLLKGYEKQTLKGVTGSGKTFTMANIIQKIQRPTLVLSHNKTLAAQLYKEFKSFFPNNAVEYFVSTYDYYQPEAYVPGKDLYIEKEVDLNAEIDRLRLHATFSLMERTDCLVVSTVSCIYGLGTPQSIEALVYIFKVGDMWDSKKILYRLVEMQYTRNDTVLERGNFTVRGDVLELWPAYLDNPVRIYVDWDTITKIETIDPINRKPVKTYNEYPVYPTKQFVMPKTDILSAISRIKSELKDRLAYFESEGKVLERERLKTRTEYDIDMLEEIGYCSGIENYSRPLQGRPEGSRPSALLDYFPDDFVTFIDESHVTLSQIGAMYEGDHSRKQTLVDYGFRLPSALDNRPLKMAEFNRIAPVRIYVSATPGETEIKESKQVVEQILRPTGLLDPSVEVRPTEGQMENLYGEIQQSIKRGERVLITTLTKRMAEELSNYLLSLKVKVTYLHSEIETIDRVEILRDLRSGKFDVLVGINLLREGLDLPEVALVAILDADKIGFLRSETSLIQTIGRAARHVNGRVIMYADRMSDAMEKAIKETQKRRKIQNEYNIAHGITPKSINKAIENILDREEDEKKNAEKQEIDVRKSRYNLLLPSDKKKYIKELEKEMKKAAEELNFEKAVVLRDEILSLKK